MSMSKRGQLISIGLESLCRGRYHPRKNICQSYVNDMALSLKAVGQTDPITITESRSVPGKFEVVEGEYRWRAALQLGLDVLEAYLIPNDEKSIAIGALTSKCGLALNPIEQAEAYARLNVEFGMSHLDIAKACGKGKNRFHVSKSIRMLQLPRVVRDYIADSKLSFTHAQILMEAPKEAVITLAEKAIDHGWDTRKLKGAIEGESKSKQAVYTKNDQKTVDWIELEQELTKTVGVPVAISSGENESKKGYEVVLSCVNKKELSRVLNCLKEGGVALGGAKDPVPSNSLDLNSQTVQ